MTLSIFPSTQDVGGGKTITEGFLSALVADPAKSWRRSGLVPSKNMGGAGLLDWTAGVAVIAGRVVNVDAGTEQAPAGTTCFLSLKLTLDVDGNATGLTTQWDTALPSDTATAKYLLLAVAVWDMGEIGVFQVLSVAPGAVLDLGSASLASDGNRSFTTSWKNDTVMNVPTLGYLAHAMIIHTAASVTVAGASGTSATVHIGVGYHDTAATVDASVAQVLASTSLKCFGVHGVATVPAGTFVRPRVKYKADGSATHVFKGGTDNPSMVNAWAVRA